MSWEEQRKELQRLEAELDAKLTTYSKIGTKYANASTFVGGSDASDAYSRSSQSGSYGHANDLESGGADFDATLLADQRMSESIRYDVEQLLKKLSLAVDAASTIINGNAAGSTLSRVQLQRHQEKLLDYRQQYQRIRKTIQESRDHAELMSHVREDISQPKNTSRTSLLLRERNSAQNADRMMDDALGQAQAARDSLASQRSMLGGISSKIGNLTESALPAVRNLLGNIRRRKTRDQLIIAAVIGLCIFLIYLYWIST